MLLLCFHFSINELVAGSAVLVVLGVAVQLGVTMIQKQMLQ